LRGWQLRYIGTIEMTIPFLIEFPSPAADLNGSGPHRLLCSYATAFLGEMM